MKHEDGKKNIYYLYPQSKNGKYSGIPSLKNSYYKNYNPIYGILKGIFMYDGIPGPWGQLWVDEIKNNKNKLE